MKQYFFSSAILTLFAILVSGCDTDTAQYKKYELEGISVVLPSPPDGPHLIHASPPADQVIKRQAGYQSSAQDFSVLVFHAENYQQFPIYIELAISGAIENMKKVPGTTDFTSELVSRYPIAGVKTSEIIIQLKQNGVPRSVQMLIIAKDNHMYQITIEGDSKKVEEWSAIAFPSIKFFTLDRATSSVGPKIEEVEQDAP